MVQFVLCLNTINFFIHKCFVVNKQNFDIDKKNYLLILKFNFDININIQNK